MIVVTKRYERLAWHAHVNIRERDKELRGALIFEPDRE
jgi:hypothetical protein